MMLLTYIASPKKLQEQAKLEFYIDNIMKLEPNLITHKCFENRHVGIFTSVLNSSSTPPNFCPYREFKQRDIDDNGAVLSCANKERIYIEWKYLVSINLFTRSALVKYIKRNIGARDFFEMYSILCNIGSPNILPEPRCIVTMSVDELQKSRDFILKDGRKFVIYR